MSVLAVFLLGLITEADVVIYGGTSAGIAAAVAVRERGHSAVVIEPSNRIGGLTTGGLGATDIGNKAAFGGLARRFYRDVRRHYDDPKAWTRQTRAEYNSSGRWPRNMDDGEAMWAFEPHVALAVFKEWVRKAGVEVVYGERLDRGAGKVKVEGEGEQRKIVSLVTESGRVFRGKVFIDATYEGDLMAAAGVSYAVGRESNAEYGETLNGRARGLATAHQLRPGVDPYVVKGDPASGLLPGIVADDGVADGGADRLVQAYCFRSCLTDVPENRIPFAKPEGYDERDYEILFRNFEAGEKRSPLGHGHMPNRKTDTNNDGGFSLDFIGMNHGYPEASYAERDRIVAAHLRYQRGLFWTLANHPRVPENVRRAAARWGTCRDEFEDGFGDGWPRQLYVREARRMKGAYVMTEHNCRATRTAPRPVALAAYTMDSHNVRRYVGADGFAHNEGNVEVKVKNGPYGIDYFAILPKREECVNLLVPVCLSASHIAYGSIRMEPVFLALGAASAEAAALAIGRGTALQDVDYTELRARLLEKGQAL